MFLRLCQAGELVQETSATENAIYYINRAKKNARQYSRSRDDRCAFLCGNAGIYAVSAAISQLISQLETLKHDLGEFAKGFEACKPVPFSKYGSDEVLVGRAGFLSGVYWLNRLIQPKPFENEAIVEICESIVMSGKHYAKKSKSFPLMYAYHGTEYLGAAHGLCSILHMLLESPWFSGKPNDSSISNELFADIKATVDAFVGKFSALSRTKKHSVKRSRSIFSIARCRRKFSVRYGRCPAFWRKYLGPLVSRCPRCNLSTRQSLFNVPRFTVSCGLH